MRRTFFLLCLLVVFLAGCSSTAGTSTVLNPEVVDQTTSMPTEELVDGLSDDEIITLNSLKLVDDYPLYVMEYSGDYGQMRLSDNDSYQRYDVLEGASWACTLFTYLADEENMLYGRNFDWEFSPALLLFTDPPDGYASVTMVDIAYLGFADDEITRLKSLPITELTPLLEAPWWPFDGMNEYGLTVGMAAVPPGNMTEDPEKPTLDSLEVMRIVLDQARNVEEAVEIFEDYNVDMGGGPPLHYLIADRSGKAVLIEFYNGEMYVIPNEQPWHLATNFLCSPITGPLRGKCWRYDQVLDELEQSGGNLEIGEAMTLLGMVSQAGTQWSVIYEMTTGRVNVVMGQAYYDVYSFHLAP
jgi:hypothetical protein